MDKFSHIIHAVQSTPWAIMPEKMAAICDLLRLRANGVKLSEEDVVARIGAAAKPRATTSGAVAVLPLYGVVAQRMDSMMQISGGTSTERFGRELTQAVDDPGVKAIVIDVDSPGGSVYGVEELASQIRAAKEKKYIVAVANSLAASAAYWIASSASELVVTPSGEVGSIGVYTVHQDYSAQLEQEGVKTTLIKAGKFKAEGNPFEPLSEDAKESLQARISEIYETFIASVAKGRGVSVAQVRDGFGQGRVVSAKEALEMKMVDRIGTLQDTLARLGGGGSQTGARAEDEIEIKAESEGDIEMKRRKLSLLSM